MRVLKADPTHCYQVFKLLKEYRQDTGLPRLVFDDYRPLLSDLLDEKKSYSLLMHGRKAIGLIWGEELEPGEFLISGMFLRRRWRSFRFKRVLVRERAKLRQNFATLKAMLPPGARPSKRMRPLGILVEEVRG